MATKTRKRFKTVQHETSASAAILDGLAAVEVLKDEMTEMRDNMEDSFSQTTKFQTIDETVGTLENVEFSPEIPEALTENDPKVSYFEDVPYGKKGPSRATQMSNALSMISAGIAGVEEMVEQLREQKEKLEAEAVDIEQDGEDDAKEAEEEAKISTDGLDPDAILRDATNRVQELNAQAEKLDEEIDALDEFKDEMESMISDIENVEFPGMFG